MTSLGSPLSWRLRANTISRSRKVHWHRLVRNVAIGLGLGIVLCAIAIGLVFSPMFRVEHIAVRGANHFQSQQIQEMARLKAGSPIALVPVRAAAHRLEQDPWIAAAKVSRDWPHGVVVHVRERNAVAMVRATSGVWLTLAADGMVLAAGEKMPTGLPVVLDLQTTASQGTMLPEQDRALLQVAGALPDSLRSKVTQLQKQGEVMRLGLQNNVIVILGDANLLGNKLMAAAAVLAQSEKPNIAILDVQSPTMPVAIPRNPSGTSTTPTPSSVPTTAPTNSTPSTANRGGTTTVPKSRASTVPSPAASRPVTSTTNTRTSTTLAR